MKNLLAVIGSAKAGTTALCQWLDTQPGISLAPFKEPRFFCDLSDRSWHPKADAFLRTGVQELDAYEAGFGDLGPADWGLDGSVDHIWYPGAADRMRAFADEPGRLVKVVAVVRDPIDRAVSEYNHTLRANIQAIPFRDALEREEERRRDAWPPLVYHERRSRIHNDLHRWREAFGDDLLMIDYADLEDMPSVIARVTQHIGLPNDMIHRPVQERFNVSVFPRNRAFTRAIKAPAVRAVGRAVLPQAVRNRIWKAAHVSSRDVETVSAKERRFLRERLADEIDACRRTPWIPTENWRSALTPV